MKWQRALRQCAGLFSAIVLGSLITLVGPDQVCAAPSKPGDRKVQSKGRGPDAEPSVKVDKDGAEIDDSKSANQLPDNPTEGFDSDLSAEENLTPDDAELEVESETENIAKDIVDEDSKPAPEFPYPGATEKGFEKPAPKSKSRSGSSSRTLTKPIRISSSGEYYYGFQSSARDSAASLKFGMFAPPQIFNPTNNIYFEDVYGSSQIPTLFFDYEWMLTRKLGDIGFKLGTGLFVSQGTGAFAVQSPDRAGKKPDEKFTFVMFPNTATAVYRFQYWETQPIVPYVEGGGGYFTFAEIRDDGAHPKAGAAAVAVVAGGVNLLMDWLDQQSVRQLDREWGINHVWLTAEVRQIKGLNDQFDFTSSIIGGGIMMEF